MKGLKKILMGWLIAAPLAFAQESTNYLPIEEGLVWTFRPFFQLPQTDKTFSDDLVESRVEQVSHRDNKSTAYITRFMGDKNLNVWLHARSGNSFINGQGYVQAFNFNVRGPYSGSFTGGIKGKGTVAVERQVAFTTRAGKVIHNCVTFTESREGRRGRTEITFAPNLGPICIKHIRNNGAAHGFELEPTTSSSSSTPAELAAN